MESVPLCLNIKDEGKGGGWRGVPEGRRMAVASNSVQGAPRVATHAEEGTGRTGESGIARR